jgi:UDP-N-acetylmuramoyl-tripeptide--D-alanyl-D-alanine ligase
MDIDSLYQVFLQSDGVQIDSRKLQPNQIFFALPGEKTHGNAFALAARNQGARLCIVSDQKLADMGSGFLMAEDPLAVLQALATYHRKKLSIPVIGITGSVAKTTSKELTAQILATRFKTFATRGNLNNHIGVPLSVLQIENSHEIAVIEMGANHIGEIDFLCQIAQPSHGLITRIGKAHIEGFGSLEGIIVGKSDLYRYLRDHQGVGFINDADPVLAVLHRGFSMEKFFIHQEVQSEITSSYPHLALRVTTRAGNFSVQTNIAGAYNQENIEAAITIGIYFGIPIQSIQEAIETYKPLANRSQRIELDTNEFILDAYNANPLSLSEAIRSFAKYETDKQKVLVIGEMLEMGLERTEVHQQLVSLIQSLQEKWAHVLMVGPIFQDLESFPRQFRAFLNIADLKEWFDDQIWKNTSFLVKGSRGIALEKLLPDQSVVS